MTDVKSIMGKRLYQRLDVNIRQNIYKTLYFDYGPLMNKFHLSIGHITRIPKARPYEKHIQ